MTQRVLEQFALIRRMDNYDDTKDKVVVTFRWHLYQILNTAISPAEFIHTAQDPNNNIHLALVKCWMTYRIKEILKADHV